MLALTMTMDCSYKVYFCPSESHSIMYIKPYWTINPWQSGPKYIPVDLYRTSDPQRQEIGKSTEFFLLSFKHS